jgi:hypothetical protein
MTKISRQAVEMYGKSGAERLAKRLAAMKMSNDAQLHKVYEQELRLAIQSEINPVAQVVAQTAKAASLRLNELIQSDNEEIATRNVHFSLNHALGTPVQKTISIQKRYNIDVLAD